MRLKLAYHFFKDFDNTGSIYERVRKTYDGPLSLAEDYMVWSITKDNIRVRLAKVDEDVLATSGDRDATKTRCKPKDSLFGHDLRWQARCEGSDSDHL